MQSNRTYRPGFHQIERQLAFYSESYDNVPTIKEVKNAIFRNTTNITVFALKGGPRSGWVEEEVLAEVMDGESVMRIVISRKVN